MDIKKLISELENCPCGRVHTADIKAVEIGHGMLARVGEILKENAFPKNILVVADRNTLRAADGILEILKASGFLCKTYVFENFREPNVEFVELIKTECSDVLGILSVGTGSLNDICRRAALLCDKEFAIFATAPSMDGFASGTAPIIENNIKSTLPARQPSIIIADTEILARSPAHLKSAGFGDIIGKLTALTDWRISNLLIGEYYCESIASLVRDALKRICSMADRVTDNDEETAGAIMEILVLTGIAMKLADVSRPASGSEHMVSHFWGMKKLEDGHIADYHGKKVGVATLLLTREYHRLCVKKDITFTEDSVDWKSVYAAYGEKFTSYVKDMNKNSMIEKLTPDLLKHSWDGICKIVAEELPSDEELERVLIAAGAATTCEEIDVDESLMRLGILYHPYMRGKITLSRLVPMTNFKYFE